MLGIAAESRHRVGLDSWSQLLALAVVLVDAAMAGLIAYKHHAEYNKLAAPASSVVGREAGDRHVSLSETGISAASEGEVGGNKVVCK